MKILSLVDYLKTDKINHTNKTTSDLFIQPANLHSDLNQHLSSTVTFILDYRTGKYSYLDPNVEHIIKHPLSILKDAGIEYWLLQFHKKDFELFNDPIFKELYRFFIQHQSVDLKNYKISFNYKVKTFDGTYIHLLQQYFVLERDAKGLPLSIYGTISDISHLMLNNNKIHLSISQLDNGISTELIHCDYFTGSDILSNRELLVLQLIVKGHTTKEIADRLFISEETVRTHRSNMLEKSNVKNMPQLVHVAHLQGWL